MLSSNGKYQVIPLVDNPKVGFVRLSHMLSYTSYFVRVPVTFNHLEGNRPIVVNKCVI